MKNSVFIRQVNEFDFFFLSLAIRESLFHRAIKASFVSKPKIKNNKGTYKVIGFSCIPS
jgi:hypothetical protein